MQVPSKAGRARRRCGSCELGLFDTGVGADLRQSMLPLVESGWSRDGLRQKVFADLGGGQKKGKSTTEMGKREEGRGKRREKKREERREKK